jgi:ribosomal protein S6--L-glutamate ligase
MHIGILTARSASYHPNRRFVEAASAIGDRISLIHPKDCLSEILHNKPGIGLSPHGRGIEVLLPRLGATINQYALTLVRHYEAAGIPVVNGYESILLARNKFLTLQALVRNRIAVPASYYVSNFRTFEKAVAKLGGYPVVAKTPNSRQGNGVILVESRSTADFIMHNLPTRADGLLVQEYIDPVGRKDVRAFVSGDQVVGAMELEPRSGDFRSNIHLKSRAKALRLDKALTELAVAATSALGLEISGTDIILAYGSPAKVIEVNYSPGFRGLEASTGRDIAGRILHDISAKYGGAR